VKLPEHGPWPHPYYGTRSQTLAVTFADARGEERRVRIHHKLAGSGPPLVLVHGLMTTSYSWRYAIAPLEAHYRLFIPDLIGSGASEKPLDLVYSVENVARFIAAYVQKLGIDPPYLAGNSLGGLHCLKAILDFPTVARRFVLMHAPGYPIPRAKLSHALLSRPPIAALGAALLRRFPEAIVARNVHYYRRDMLSEEEVREYARQFKSPGGAEVFVRLLRESLDPAEHASIIGELRARAAEGRPFPCPVLVFYARNDPLVPAEFGYRYAEDIPDVELSWMEESSHFLQVCQPERAAARIVGFDGKRAEAERTPLAGSESLD
jgi:pimeloyl-ACP methyl ester carboxylesterase